MRSTVGHEPRATLGGGWALFSEPALRLLSLAPSAVPQSRPSCPTKRHAKTHTYAVVKTTSGQLMGCQQFPTTPQGITRAIGWVSRLTGGDAEALWAIEGVATYGARVARAASQVGYEVAEAPG
jgi:hypothetical protein